MELPVGETGRVVTRCPDWTTWDVGGAKGSQPGSHSAGRFRLQDRTRNNKWSVWERDRALYYRKKSMELGLDPHDPKNPYFTRPPRTRGKK